MLDGWRLIAMHPLLPCRSTITCVTDNRIVFLHYLSRKTTCHQNAQKSSQSRDPKLAFSSETAPYYFHFLRYLYSSNPAWLCPVAAVQLTTCKGRFHYHIPHYFVKAINGQNGLLVAERASSKYSPNFLCCTSS